jgi:hypothetical protein
MEDLRVTVAWFCEQRKGFWSSFESARFAAARTIRDPIAGEGEEQIVPELSA